MKQISKLLILFTLIFTASCNIDAPAYTTISDFGFISLRSADKQYYIETDENGLIFSAETFVPIKESDVGKRVRVEFTIITESNFGDNVSITNMGYTPFANAYSISEINSWEKDKRDEFYDTLGNTAMKYSSISYSKRGYMNFIFQTLTNNSDGTPNGTSVLILDDSKPEDGTTRYTWYYGAKGDAKNLTLTYASFAVRPFMMPDTYIYPIEITYKSLETGEDTLLEFPIDLTPSLDGELKKK